MIQGTLLHISTKWPKCNDTRYDDFDGNSIKSEICQNVIFLLLRKPEVDRIIPQEALPINSGRYPVGR